MSFQASIQGVWAADLEMDGDLDLVRRTTRDVSVTVLRNNGDGTFAAIQPFEGANGLRDFAWADLDQDGDPDATILDSHFALRIFTNERAGRFQLQPAPDGIGTVIALAVADLYNDGAMDVLVLKKAGMIARATAVDGGRSWETADVTPSAAAVEAQRALFVADLDNNGALDLIASAQAGGWIGLSDQSGRFRSVPYPVGLYVLDVVDFNADGRLDLVGLFQGRGTSFHVSRPGQQKLPLARHPASGGQGLRRRQDQLIRPGRRGRSTVGSARSKAGRGRPSTSFRPGRPRPSRCCAYRLAQRNVSS